MKLKVGIYGIAHDHCAAKVECLKARDDVEIIGIFEPNREIRISRTARHPDIYKDLPFITESELFAADAMLVESDDRIAACLKCAERGKHIHMDKPAGTDIESFDRLLNEIERQGVVFQTGYMYRYNPGIKEILGAAKNGKLGKIYNIDARMSTKHTPDFKTRLKNRLASSPVMYVFGCHLIDLILALKGEPRSIAAFSANSGDDGIKFDDTSLLVMTYPDGIATVKVSSSEVNGFGMREFTVCGEKATMRVCPIESPTLLHTSLAHECSSWESHERVTELPDSGRYDEMMDEFIRLCRGEIKSHYSLAHERLLHKYTLAACGLIELK